MDKLKDTQGTAVLGEGGSSPLFNQAELARFLKVGTATLASWRKAGTGPKFIRPNSPTSKTVIYLRETVMAWLKEQEQQIQVIYKPRPGPRPRDTDLPSKKKPKRGKRNNNAPTEAQSPGA